MLLLLATHGLASLLFVDNSCLRRPHETFLALLAALAEVMLIHRQHLCVSCALQHVPPLMRPRLVKLLPRQLQLLLAYWLGKQTLPSTLRRRSVRAFVEQNNRGHIYTHICMYIIYIHIYNYIDRSFEKRNVFL